MYAGDARSKNAAVSVVFAYARLVAVTVAGEETQRHQRVKEVGSTAVVETRALGDLRARHRAGTERGEHVEFHGRQERLRGEEAEPDLQDLRGA